MVDIQYCTILLDYCNVIKSLVRHHIEIFSILLYQLKTRNKIVQKKLKWVISNQLLSFDTFPPLLPFDFEKSLLLENTN